MSYIEREALKEHIGSFAGKFDDDGFWVDLQAVLRAIDFAPSADAVEVRHGRWIEHPHFNFEGGYSGANYECPNCHYDDCYEETPYCPKCGAKMDGERRSENERT